jgi:hypothetical protein
LWGHDAPLVVTLAQESNCFLSALSKAKAGRHLRKAADLWPKAGRILLAERLRFNSQRLSAVRTDSKVLSNVWWPLSFNKENDAVEKALILWLNSTLGLTILLAHRIETEGAWMKFRKPVLEGMPVLSVGGLKAKQLTSLSKTYDNLCNKEILPFPHMAHDPVRKAIDEAISNTLGLPDIAVLREMLAREPVVCLKNIGTAAASTLSPKP